MAKKFEDIHNNIASMVDRIRWAEGSAGHPCWVITGSQPGEGSTTISLLVARELAARGKSVVLVDANLRDPALHECCAVTATPGLVQVFTGSCTLDEALRPAVAGAGEHPVHVMVAGGTVDDPLELLAPAQVGSLLADLKNRFDITIIDTPAVNSSLDVAQFTPVADAVILVLRAGTTSRREARESVAALTAAGGNVIGVVLNQYQG